MDNSRHTPPAPTLFNNILSSSTLKLTSYFNGKLATVKALKDKEYLAVSLEEKIQALNQIKEALSDTLTIYNKLWQPRIGKNNRSSYLAFKKILNDINNHENNLEYAVNRLTESFKTSAGKWKAGVWYETTWLCIGQQRVYPCEPYPKAMLNSAANCDDIPSLKTILMRKLLTIPIFNRKIKDNTLTLVTRTELTHGLKYQLDLTQDYLGGCSVGGLVRFFENECKHFAGLGKPTTDEEQVISATTASVSHLC